MGFRRLIPVLLLLAALPQVLSAHACEVKAVGNEPLVRKAASILSEELDKRSTTSSFAQQFKEVLVGLESSFDNPALSGLAPTGPEGFKIYRTSKS